MHPYFKGLCLLWTPSGGRQGLLPQITTLEDKEFSTHSWQDRVYNWRLMPSLSCALFCNTYVVDYPGWPILCILFIFYPQFPCYHLFPPLLSGSWLLVVSDFCSIIFMYLSRKEWEESINPSSSRLVMRRCSKYLPTLKVQCPLMKVTIIDGNVKTYISIDRLCRVAGQESCLLSFFVTCFNNFWYSLPLQIMFMYCMSVLQFSLL